MIEYSQYVTLSYKIPDHGKAGLVPDGLNIFLLYEGSDHGPVWIKQNGVVEYNQSEGWFTKFVRGEDGQIIKTPDGGGLKTERIVGKIRASFRDSVRD